MHNMGQTFHKFRAATFDEAYQKMVRALGDDALVINTAEVTEGGILGLGGRKVIELTATPPVQGRLAAARRPSLIEKRYAAQGATLGSDETMNDTIAYFRQVVSDAQARMAVGKGLQPLVSPPLRRDKPGSILPFPRGADSARDTEGVQRELQEMRQLLQALVKESPDAVMPAEFLPHYHALLERGVARAVAASLVAAVLRESDPSVLRNPRVFRERLRMEMHKRISVTRGIQLVRGRRRTVALVGATGVGKTTNLAKLAALFAVQERAPVGLITMDTYRVAAPEQLRVYANIMGLPMRITNDAAELTYALNAFREYDLVLMDTAGGSQFNQEQIRELKSLLDIARPDEVMLVLPANMQVEELRSVVESFRCTNPTSLLFSKLDETRRYGALFSIAVEANLPLSYFSVGQNVPDDIELATPSKTAKLLLEDSDSRVGSSAKSS